MSAISKRDLNDLARAAKGATNHLDQLLPRAKALSAELTQLTTALGELSSAERERVQPRQVPIQSKRERLLATLTSLSFWVALANIGALVVALFMLVPTLQSLDATQQSLEATQLSAIAAQEALQRDEVSQTFSSSAAACVSVADDLVSTKVRGTTLSTVITNTGRLPITILDVKGKGADGVSSVPYAWVPLELDARVSEGGPIYLEVGKAVALRVFIPGGWFSNALWFALSNGQTDQEADYHPFPASAEVPSLVSIAYEELPELCGGE